MIKDQQEVGALIMAARKERGLSQTELAVMLGFQSATAISLIENGERKVSTDLLQRLSSVLQRDIKYFLGEKELNSDVSIALRADKDLSKQDKDAILRFIELAKKKNGR